MNSTVRIEIFLGYVNLCRMECVYVCVCLKHLFVSRISSSVSEHSISNNLNVSVEEVCMCIREVLVLL